MSGLILCGKKARVPLHSEISDIEIYSLEELCYYLYNNVYILDAGFFNQEFFDFLKELELDNLIQRLNGDILSKKSYLRLISDIIAYTDYYSSKEKVAIGEKLMMIENRTPYENMKDRADGLKEKGKEEKALELYKEIIANRELQTSDKVMAGAWNNIGVIKTAAFCYKEALDCFQRAADLDEVQEYTDNIICAVIMCERYEKPGDYRKDVAAKYNIEDDIFEKYNEVIKREEKSISCNHETMEFREKLAYKSKTNMEQYYRDIDHIMNKWKDEYRKQERERLSE